MVRKQDIVTDLGYRVSLINVGTKEMDLQLDWNAFDRVMRVQDPEGRIKVDEKPITILLDNRSFGQVLIDALQGKSAHPLEMAPFEDLARRIEYSTEKTHYRTIYLNTQDLLFLEMFGSAGLEKKMRHGLKHLSHTPDWVREHYGGNFETKYSLTKYASILGGVISGGLLGIGISKVFYDSIPVNGKGDNLEQVLANYGMILLGFGIMKLSDKIIDFDPAEKEARIAETSEPELHIFLTRPQHFISRLIGKK